MTQAHGFTLLFRLLLNNQNQIKWGTACLSCVHLDLQDPTEV